MNGVSGFVLYVIIWWTLLFAVLPWGNKPAQYVVLGHAKEAPERPRLWIKFIINSVLSGVIWSITYFIITHELISLDTLSLIKIQ